MPEPNQSPWGEIQYCTTLCPGVYMVETAGHGGTMVGPEAIPRLSTAAKKCGFRQGGFLCFEADSQEAVILRELLDLRLWSVPDRISDKAGFMKWLDQSIQEYNPAYWGSRERRLKLTKKPTRTFR